MFGVTMPTQIHKMQTGVIPPHPTCQSLTICGKDDFACLADHLRSALGAHARRRPAGRPGGQEGVGQAGSGEVRRGPRLQGRQRGREEVRQAGRQRGSGGGEAGRQVPDTVHPQFIELKRLGEAPRRLAPPFDPLSACMHTRIQMIEHIWSCGFCQGGWRCLIHITPN